MTTAGSRALERAVVDSGIVRSADERAFDEICRVEREYDLLQFRIDGWCIWPTMRFAVGRALVREMLSHGSAAPTPRSERARAIARDATAFMRARPARVLVQTYTSGLAELVDGRYKDIWFDDLLVRLDRSFKVEALNSPAFEDRRSAALVPSDITTAAADAVVRIAAHAPLARAERRAAAALSDCMITEFGITRYTPRWIERIMQGFRWSRRVNALLLRRVKPSYVIVADPGEHALIAAAKERGATTLELQHGINHRHHAGYAWTAYARPYRARMPVPDRILLYGEHWREELDVGQFWGDSLRPVGSTRIDGYRARRDARPTSGPVRLLVTTQGIERDALIALLANFLEVARGRLDAYVVLKLHPVYDHDKAPYAVLHRGGASVEVLHANEGASTFEQLAQADLHVSISSAVHYDALGLGVPTAVLGLPTHEVVKHLCDAGHAALVSGGDDLFRAAQTARSTGVPQDVRDYYFRPGALDAILRELA